MGQADEVRAALTPPQRAALAAIVAGREAWSSVAALALAGADGATLDELAGLGLVERWRPAIGSLADDLATLTPWGAWVLAVEIDERFTVEEQAELEVPHWAEAGCWERAVVLPRHSRGYRMPLPELVADHAPTPPECLVTGDDNRPKLMGLPVTIDPRLGKKPAPRKGRKRAG